MGWIRKISDPIILALQVLNTLLFLFRTSLEIPVWLQPVGRMHPLLLHLPIGIGLFLWVLFFFRKESDRGLLQNLESVTLRIAALATSFTTLMGILLAAEAGYNPEEIYLHALAGVVLSFCFWALILIHSGSGAVAYTLSLTITTVLIFTTGHLGAGITHGKDFIMAPLHQTKEVVVTPETPFFNAAILPIVEAKCKSCHNPGKRKGGLDLSSFEQLLQGGKHGAVIIQGSGDSSELIRRILLPANHDDHMPPDGKPQVETLELKLLQHWIQSGANASLTWNEIPDSVKSWSKSYRRPVATKGYDFPAADSETIKKLNTPYCTVQPLATNEPALKADFFVKSEFNPESFLNLDLVATQLVQLNLTNMPVRVTDFNNLSKFKNLEHLNLAGTPFNSEHSKMLGSLQNLKTLSLSNTKVGFEGLKELGALPALKEVFFWNCPVSDPEIAKLQELYPKISWNSGYHTNETLPLTVPLADTEGFLLPPGGEIKFKHNLLGTSIHYTMDGTDPDSLSSQYKQPIKITSYMVIRAKAYKPGWKPSPVAEFRYFMDGFTPQRLSLLTQPAKEYAAAGAKILIDHKKGEPGNFRDGGWLGYRETPAEILVQIPGGRQLSKLTLSYSQQIGSYIMPPTRVEIWGGNNRESWELVNKITPAQPTGYEPDFVVGLILPVAKQFQFYKVKVFPVSKLPLWHSGKGDKGWVFLDELIFE